MFSVSHALDSTVRRNIASIALTAQVTLAKICEIRSSRGMSYELMHDRVAALRMTIGVLDCR